MNNVYGYTDDDLVAFTSGRGSIGGVATGVNININQKNIIVDNVRGIAKNGYSPWCGVCIYGNKSNVGNIKITNVNGDFQLYAFRIGDYWYNDTNTITWTIKNIEIANSYVSAVKSDRIFKILNCNIDNFIVKNSEFVENNMNKAKAMIDFTNCIVGNFTLSSSAVVANSSDTNKYYLVQQTSGGKILNAVIEKIFTSKYASNEDTNTVLCYFTDCENITFRDIKCLYGSPNFYLSMFNIISNYSIKSDLIMKEGIQKFDNDIIINSIYSTFIEGSIQTTFDITVNNITSSDKSLLKFNDLFSRINFQSNTYTSITKLTSDGINSNLMFDKNNKVIKLINPSFNNSIVPTSARIIASLSIPTK